MKIEIEISDEMNRDNQPFTMVAIKIYKEEKRHANWYDHWDCNTREEAVKLLPQMVEQAIGEFFQQRKPKLT